MKMTAKNLKMTGVLNAELVKAKGEEYIESYIRSEVEKRMRNMLDVRFTGNIGVRTEYQVMTSDYRIVDTIRMAFEYSHATGAKKYPDKNG